MSISRAKGLKNEPKWTCGVININGQNYYKKSRGSYEHIWPSFDCDGNTAINTAELRQCCHTNKKADNNMNQLAR